MTATLDRIEVARLLIESGANKEVRSIENKTALDCAVSNPMRILLQSKSKKDSLVRFN